MKEKNALLRERPDTNVRVRITMQGLPSCPQSKTNGNEESSARMVTERREDVRRVESKNWPGPSKKARHRIIRRVQVQDMSITDRFLQGKSQPQRLYEQAPYSIN